MPPVTESSDLHLRLSQQIIDHCRREGYERGHRLTERELAQQLGVSRSPVRGALQLLTKEKVVTKKPGWGYLLNHGAANLNKQNISFPQGSAETLYLQILRDRFSGRIPDQISEADIMRTYGVPRGTLRKVLLRLSQEGFAHRGQGYGWIFDEVLNTVDAYRASYDTRLAIEPTAIRSPGFSPNRGLLEKLYRTHKDVENGRARGLNSIKLFELDAELHETLVTFSGNRYFVQIIRYHNQLRRIVEYESFEAGERMDDSTDEHVRILEALIDDDREWAAMLMTRHLTLAKEAVAVFTSTG